MTAAPATADWATAFCESVSRSLPEVFGHKDRARFIAEHSELLRPEVVATLSDWIPKLIRTDARKALMLANLAHSIARQLNQSESLALAFRAKANVFHVAGKNKAAVMCHERARSLFAKDGNKTQTARTLSSSIQPLILLGEYGRAYAAAQEASTIFREDGNTWRLARVELNTGNIFDRQDRFSEALEYYLRAYQHLKPHRDQDPEAVAVALHNMAGCHVCLNDFHAAMRTYEEARAFANLHALPTLVAQSDYNIATLHYLRGEYTRAITLLRSVRETFRKSGDNYHFALCHLDLSEIYLEMNMAAEAEDAAAISQAAFQRLAMRYEEAKSSTNLAIALSEQGKLTESGAQFHESRILFLNENNRVWSSLVDLYEAFSLFKHGSDEKAQELAASALRFFKRNSNINRAVLCELLLARIFLRADDLRSALHHCYRALIRARKIESPSLHCQASALMGQIQKSLGNRGAAFEHFQLAKGFLEQLRCGIQNDELKISFMRDRGEIYEGLVDLCMSAECNNLHETFGYIEQAKSRSLFDLITAKQERITLQDGATSPAMARIEELRSELSWYAHRMEIEGRDPNAVHRLSQLVSERRQREREILHLWREHSSSNRDLDATSSDKYFAVDQIQQALHKDATIVEYFQVGNQLVAAVLRSNSLEIRKIGDMPSVEGLMAALRYQMSKPRLGFEYVSAFEDLLVRTAQNCLKQLYEQLIAPIRNQLQTSHVIIVPHACLHHLPFHLLFDGERYLLDDFTISYAPSASVYTFCDARPANTEGPALVLGVPEPSIPAVEIEAAAIARLLPDVHLAIGEHATSSLLTEVGAKSRFLHIATHGHFREDQPMFSGIRLADSSLSLYDLYQMKLPVELATLSGCSTGLNTVAGGDELLGLARGLIAAGAQSALLSLWDVQDQSTAEFMNHFYERLQKTNNKAEASRDAALKVRESRRHPYYWGPFVLIGKVFSKPK